MKKDATASSPAGRQEIVATAADFDEHGALTRDFLREARATASCEHENIVIIHEADEHDGTPYMVLEHLDGSNLRQAAGGHKQAPARAVELIVPVHLPADNRVVTMAELAKWIGRAAPTH